MTRLMLMSQAEVNARMQRWGDTEFRRFAARMQILERRHVENAEAVADRLILRDQDKDDRHLCVECAHLRPQVRCAAPGGYPIADHLFFRCPQFSWEKP